MPSVPDEKQLTERTVFERFAEKAGLAVRVGSIQQPDPPDICCEVAGLGRVGFELVHVDDSGDLERMGALYAVDRLWAQVVASLPDAARERVIRAGLTVAFAPGQGRRQRCAALAQVAHQLAPLPAGYEGNLPKPLPPGLVLALVYRAAGAPTVREVSTHGAASVQLSRIDDKLAAYAGGFGMRAELLAYARWGFPFTDQQHDAAAYLAARFPHQVFARGWLFEFASARIVARAP